MRPVFGRRDKTVQRVVEVSFLQLAEIVIVSRFRSGKVTLRRIRNAHQYARDTWYLDYPFARLSLQTDGVRVLSEFEREEPGVTLLALDESGQLTLPGYVAVAIETFDFEQDLAARWFPLGKTVPIVIDPQYCAGVPTIPKRRLTIHAIRKRWTAGYSIDFIADDLVLDAELVEDALRYSQKVAV